MLNPRGGASGSARNIVTEFRPQHRQYLGPVPSTIIAGSRVPSGSTRQPSWIAPSYEEQTAQDDLIEKWRSTSLDSVLNSNTTRRRCARRLQARPSIPPDIDRALLIPPDALGVDDLDANITPPPPRRLPWRAKSTRDGDGISPLVALCLSGPLPMSPRWGDQGYPSR